MLRLKDLFKIDLSSKGGGKLAEKIFNKYNITKEERKEIKNEIASGGGGGDSEEVWYILTASDDLTSDTKELLKGISTGFNLIKAYIETYGGGAYTVTNSSLEHVDNITGYSNIVCFSFSGGIFSTNTIGNIYINIKSDKIENIFDLYFNLFSSTIPPEALEQTKLMINNIIQEVNDKYDCVNKEEMLAYLESRYNN